MANQRESIFLPYIELMRLTKAALFFFWPAFWGCTMAAYCVKSPFEVYVKHLAKSLVGCLIIRSSGCTINDILDRDYDACVERCKTRPLPSGRVSVRSAWIFFAVQLVVGIAFFATYDQEPFVAGMVQLIPLSCLYPFMKRITYWPQAWLGLALNASIIFSWLSVAPDTGRRTLWLMLAAMWCWTMVYETVYACQDMRDDAKAGVKSTGVILADYIRLIVTIFTIGLVSLLALAGKANGQGVPYFLFGVGGVAIQMAWQLMSLDVWSPASCWSFFRRNSRYVGSLVFLGLFVDYVRVMW